MEPSPVRFRCHCAEAAQLRIDVMSALRGIDPFPDPWERRTTLVDAEGATWDVMNIAGERAEFRAGWSVPSIAATKHAHTS
jgi:hypothetical protein